MPVCLPACLLHFIFLHLTEHHLHLSPFFPVPFSFLYNNSNNNTIFRSYAAFFHSSLSLFLSPNECFNTLSTILFNHSFLCFFSIELVTVKSFLWGRRLFLSVFPTDQRVVYYS